jgi:hypothetical protein
MKRPWLIAVLGLVLGLSGFGVLYANKTAAHRELCEATGPELAWIKKEFQLNDTDFRHIRQLHEAYKPVCAEMCRRIDEKNRELGTVLAQSINVTPEIEKVLGEAAQLRRECQTEMLKHFFAVSRAMPPEQGRRYLAWMHSQTLAPTHPAMLPQIPNAATQERHGH